MTRSFRYSVGLAMLAALLVMPATAGAQSEDEPFRRGLSARGDKKWQEAAQAMRQALQINRMESSRRVQGGFRIFGRGTEYLPFYFLGEALKNLNDCSGAVTAWESSEEQKVVLTVKEYADSLRAGLKECASKGVLLRPEYNQQMAVTDQNYNESYALLQRLVALRDANQELWRPDVQAEYERARGDMALAQKTLLKARQSRMVVDFAESRALSLRARDVLRPLESRLTAAIGTRSLIAQQVAEAQKVLEGAEAASKEIDAAKLPLSPTLASSRDSARALATRARERLGQLEKSENAATATEAVRLAHEASDAFTKVLEQVKKSERSDFEQRLQEAVAGATEQLSFAATSLASLERLVAEKPATMTPEMASQRDALVREHAALQRRFDNARKTENIVAVDEARRLAGEARDKIDALVRLFGGVVNVVPAALNQGASYYLAGNYKEALTALDPLASQTDIPLRVHVHLFRAASLYALYVRSGEKDQALRADALAAIQKCKEIDSAFRPDPRAFSPRFLSFFQSVGAPGAQAPPSSQ
jgi:hypothetical protein